MCLIVSSFWHGRYPKPKIAKRNIHVWKGLMNFDNKPYLTPCRHAKILFLKGVAVQTADLQCKTRPYETGLYYVVTEGIHAALTKRKVRAIFNEFVPLKYQSFHHAIIPKGSKYYMGGIFEQDIVSDQLLVFETEEAYKYYRKKNYNLA